MCCLNPLSYFSFLNVICESPVCASVTHSFQKPLVDLIVAQAWNHGKVFGSNDFACVEQLPPHKFHCLGCMLTRTLRVLVREKLTQCSPPLLSRCLWFRFHHFEYGFEKYFQYLCSELYKKNYVDFWFIFPVGRQLGHHAYLQYRDNILHSFI